MIRNSLPRGYQNVELLEKKLSTKKEHEWLRVGKRRALRQLKEMFEDVPAYKDFLAKHKYSASSLTDIRSLDTIPAINKDNYLRVYEKSALCWDGDFASERWVISTTSGSSGVPYYFPRTDVQDEYLTVTTELYLRSNFDIQNKTTLYINAFPMGAWIGGLFTYESVKRVAEKGYSISIISPGVHKQEVINAVKQLGKSFDQIVIGAYAPFLKDILDDGEEQGVDWQAYSIGFIFSAEAFTEVFREYVNKKVGAKDILRTTLNHYGTVDMGTMAHETPLSILIRRLLVNDNKLDILFPEANRQPTFAQYNPELFYFESTNNNLYCTSYSGLPLVKYDLKDYGGVIKKAEVYKILSDNGYDVDKLIREAGIEDTVWELPFVYVYERNDFSVSYYAFLIYPDTVRRSLQTTELMKLVSGKFTMLVDFDKTGRQKLHIHVEKANDQDAEVTSEVLREIIHKKMIEEISEYRETFGVIGEPAKPEIHLWDYGDEKYFKSGAKQKWVIK